VKMRFIEFMPLDSGHDWSRNDVVSGREIRERITIVSHWCGGVRALRNFSRYRFADGAPAR